MISIVVHHLIPHVYQFLYISSVIFYTKRLSRLSLIPVAHIYDIQLIIRSFPFTVMFVIWLKGLSVSTILIFPVMDFYCTF